MNPNKAHGHDNISIRMLKTCGSTIYRPLEINFKEVLSIGFFPSEWKKETFFLSIKKVIRKSLKITAPFNCSQFMAKIFERLIFNEIFSFLLENNLVSPNQSGDSCINRLLSITHKIF